MAELPFTNVQGIALANERAMIRNQIDTILKMAKEFHDAYVKLPHKNEKGESVVWGCNLRMIRRMEAWISAARELFNILSREDQEEIRITWNINFSQLRFNEKEKVS